MAQGQPTFMLTDAQFDAYIRHACLETCIAKKFVRGPELRVAVDEMHAIVMGANPFLQQPESGGREAVAADAGGASSQPDAPPDAGEADKKAKAAKAA